MNVLLPTWSLSMAVFFQKQNCCSALAGSVGDHCLLFYCYDRYTINTIYFVAAKFPRIIEDFLIIYTGGVGILQHMRFEV